MKRGDSMVRTKPADRERSVAEVLASIPWERERDARRERTSAFLDRIR